MRAIQWYVWHRDGHQQNSSLIHALEGRLGTTTADIQVWTTQSQSSVLAQLAPLVLEHASAGDELAKSIIGEAVSHCLNLLKLAPDDLAVYVVGGVGDQLRPLLTQSLGARMAIARGDALHGLWQISRQRGVGR